MAAEDWLAEELDEWEDAPSATARRRKAVGYLANQPGMPKNHGQPWTPVLDKVLKAHYRNKLPISTIARELGRTEMSIILRLGTLGEKVKTEVWPTNSFDNQRLSAWPQGTPAQQPLKGTKFVNLIHAITLLQEGYTTLEVVYPNNNQRYTFKVANTLRERLKEDDYVVVFTRDEYKVVKVVKIHDKPQIDVKAPFELKWIVCRVETETYLDQTRREAEAVERMATAERRRAAEEAAAALFAHVGSREELLALINPR